MHQSSLFESNDKKSASPKFEKHALYGGELEINRSWIDECASAKLFDVLYRSIPWEQPQIQVYGNTHSIPRKQAWYGNEGAVMVYSGTSFKPLPWIAPLLEVKRKLEADVEESFNSVLANLYRNGEDTVGWHADDELELGSTPLIASLSLGATRVFRLKPKPNKQANKKAQVYDGQTELPAKPIELPLHSGDLLIMKGSLQKFWHHSVPREKGVSLPRINLTFRKIITPTQLSAR